MLAAAALWPALALAQPAPAAVQASQLIGMAVRGPEGKVGRLSELIIDIANNRVHYAVIEMPGRVFSEPLPALQLSQDGRAARLAKTSPAPVAPRAGMALVRTSELLGWKFESEPGIALGRILNVMVDPASGAVPFAVVRLNDARAAALRAVPLDAFAMSPMRENLVLTIDPARVKAAPAFGAAGLKDPRFVERHAAQADALTEPAEPAATGASRGTGATFARLDRDGDGFVSDRELDRPLAERRNWLAIDLNGDGRISRAEFEAMRGE